MNGSIDDTDSTSNKRKNRQTRHQNKKILCSKRQTIEWEKSFTNHVSDKKVICKYKELL